MKKINSLVLSTITAAFLVGCGGGGGGSSTPSSGNGGNITSNTNIGGSVIDGYIKNAAWIWII